MQVDTLDNVLHGRCPALIKIDLEGFETEVLLGADKTLADERLNAIIIELNGSGSRYGYDENKIHQHLTDHGFLPYSYNPKIRKLERIESYGTHNTIYVRDATAALDRIATAPKVRIGRKERYI